MIEKKKIRLRVLSRMRDPEGEVHEMKHARSGLMARTTEGIVLEYDDEQDGEKAHIELTFDKGRARMKRMGMISAQLTFLPGTKTSSTYVTIYGEIPVAVDTRRVLISETENGGELLLDYDVYMGGEKTSSAVMTITWRG